MYQGTHQPDYINDRQARSAVGEEEEAAAVVVDVC